MDNLIIYPKSVKGEYDFSYEYMDTDGAEIYLPLTKKFIDIAIYEKLVKEDDIHPYRNIDLSDFVLLPAETVRNIITALKVMSELDDVEQIFSSYLLSSKEKVENKLDELSIDKKNAMKSYNRILDTIMDY